jgi:hypothetical protein
MSDAYGRLTEIADSVGRCAAQLGAAAAGREPLTNRGSLDELHAIAERLAEGVSSLADLLDWVEESDLPPGLRAFIAGGASRLTVAPSTGTAAAASSPGEEDEPLPALSGAAGGGTEAVRLSVRAVGAPGGRGRDVPDDVLLSTPEASVAMTALPEVLGSADGLSPSAELRVSPRGARRLAAKLRIAARASEDALRRGRS